MIVPWAYIERSDVEGVRFDLVPHFKFYLNQGGFWLCSKLWRIKQRKEIF